MNSVRELGTGLLLLLPLFLAAPQLAGVRSKEVGLPIGDHEFRRGVRLES